jgi:hypothetical protein
VFDRNPVHRSLVLDVVRQAGNKSFGWTAISPQNLFGITYALGRFATKCPEVGQIVKRDMGSELVTRLSGSLAVRFFYFFELGRYPGMCFFFVEVITRPVYNSLSFLSIFSFCLVQAFSEFSAVGNF